MGAFAGQQTPAGDPALVGLQAPHWGQGRLRGSRGAQPCWEQLLRAATVRCLWNNELKPGLFQRGRSLLVRRQWDITRRGLSNTTHTHTTHHIHTPHTHHVHTPHIYTYHTLHAYTHHTPHTHHRNTHTHTYRQGAPRGEWSCKSPSAASQPKGQAERGV